MTAQLQAVLVLVALAAVAAMFVVIAVGITVPALRESAAAPIAALICGVVSLLALTGAAAPDTVLLLREVVDVATGAEPQP